MPSGTILSDIAGDAQCLICCSPKLRINSMGTYSPSVRNNRLMWLAQYLACLVDYTELVDRFIDGRAILA